MKAAAEARPPVESFETQGYHLVRNVLSAERVSQVRDFIKAEFDRRFSDENLTRTDVLYDFLCAYPNLIDTFANPKLVDALNLLIGKGFVLLPAVHVLRNSFAKLHTDTTSFETLGHDWVNRPDFNVVTVGLYLQDCDEQGGGLFLVPGSHRKADPIVKQRALADGIGVPLISKVLRKVTKDRFPNYNDYSKFEKGGLDLPTRAGDAAIFSMKILHRGSAAVSPRKISKIGLFFHATPPGPIVDKYLEYLKSRKDQHYAYIHEGRNLGPLQQAAQTFGFTAL